MRLLTAAVLATAFALPAHAQQASFDLGLGATYSPAYPGADSMETTPWLIVRREGAAQGLGFGGSFAYRPARDAGDGPALAGTPDIDPAFELGGKVSYGVGDVTGFATLRKGFGGHEGLTGELGVRHRAQVNDALSLTSTIEAGFADDKYMDTYFGVPGGYQAGGGLKDVSARVGARYAVTDTIAVLGEVEYARLQGDAADSPLVEKKGQPMLRVGIVRNFSFGF